MGKVVLRFSLALGLLGFVPEHLLADTHVSLKKPNRTYPQHYP